jgi:hypothetical protein
MKLVAKIFFLPGDLVADLLGATKADDRTMVDMLFWNLIVVIFVMVISL